MKKIFFGFLNIHLLISFVASALLHYLSNFNFFICFVIVEAALLLNGFIAGSGRSSKPK